MANYATLRGPVGLNRVYASVANGALGSESWLEALRQGRTFATNGPLLDFSVAGHPIRPTPRPPRGASGALSARPPSIAPPGPPQAVPPPRVPPEPAPGTHPDR